MKKGKKILAAFLAVLMVVGIMPFTSFSGLFASKANAEESDNKTLTYTFDAADALKNIEKSAKISEGTQYAEFFTTYGSTKRANMDTFAIDVGKNGDAGLKFVIPDGYTANISVSARGGGSGKTATIEIAGTAKEFDGSTIETKSWADIEAGSVSIKSTNPNNVSGGSRITKVVVKLEKTVTLEPYSVTFDAADALKDIEKSAKISEGTKYAEFFTTYGSTKRANMDTFAIDVGKNGDAGLKFVIPDGYTANISVSARGGGSGKTATIEIAGTAKEFDGSTVETKSWADIEAGSVSIKSTNPNNVSGGSRITKVVVELQPTGSKPSKEKTPWKDIATPTVKATVDKDEVKLTTDAIVDAYTGADSVAFVMINSDGKETIKKVTSEGELSHAFSPEATGAYRFKVVASRENEEDKVSDEVKIDFILPLATPSITSATSAGNGVIDITIGTVKEATSYNVYVDEAFVGSTVNGSYRITGLEVGKRYSITAEAVRSNPEAVSEKSEKVEATATAEAQMVWSKSTYGSSVDTKNNGVSGNINDGSATIYSEGGKGKLVPASKDGLTFNYITVPANKSFAISGKIHVDKWTLSNGQEGFGLMVSDRVGKDGDGSDFWTNSIQAVASKVEYYYDGTAVTTDNTQAKISMKLGVGVYAKTGITAQDDADITAGKITAPATATDKTKFFQRTLETSKASEGAGTYNIIGNGTKGETGITDMYFSMEEIETDGEIGYIVTYMDENKNVIGQDTIMGDMTLLDKDNKYVGFFAARNARITVSDVNVEIRNSARQVVIEDRVVVPNYNVISATNANSENYALTYKSDVNGTVTITAEDGTVIADNYVVEAYKTYKFNTTLKMGTNKFTVVSTPEEGYRPSKHEVLSSYDTVTQEFKVTYNGFDGTVIYVGPEGKASATGSKTDPVDIYTAVKYAKAGQKILLSGETYNLESTVKISRGVDGTADKMIYLIADPEATERPVLDFGKNCEGMVFGGNYWYISGFDVTNSADSKDGARLCGNYNVVDNCNFYHNGNTGLQISAYNNSNDDRADWPAYNLVLNCTSYGNADKGYEDADGFAAKLTVGEGNVFDGCLAYNNADDGWDLFAKTQTGNIGAVTIKNCVAYGNGYLEDGTDAGNGNGFKMGGDSLTGYHKLINCVAFNNKAKGIDSNSCPDIQIENSISFNNESYNVALYTNSAVNTDFSAKGIVSFRTTGTDIAEQFKFKGTQDQAKVYNSSNYFWNCTEAGTNNANGLVTADWFKSIDTTYDAATHKFAKVVVTRNADGTLNLNGVLTITDAKAAELGFVPGLGKGTASLELDKVITSDDVVTSGLIVKTGDFATHMIPVYVGIMLVAMLGAAFVLLEEKKRKRA